MGEIREPIKKSSIEKKKRIIAKGFELMCNKGYHNITCVDIALYSGVSTGIIYQYFIDKRDIFIAGVKDYSDKIMFPMLDIVSDKKVDLSNLNKLLDYMIEAFIKNHTMDKIAHEQLMAMSHLDDKVAKIFKEAEMQMTDRIYIILNNNGIKKMNLKELIHISINMVDNYCHEIVYHKHKDLDYDIMKTIVIDTVVNLIKQ